MVNNAIPQETCHTATPDISTPTPYKGHHTTLKLLLLHYTHYTSLTFPTKSLVLICFFYDDMPRGETLAVHGGSVTQRQNITITTPQPNLC